MNWYDKKPVLRLDKSKDQRQVTDSKGNERVEGECGLCSSYGDPELDNHYLKTSKHGVVLRINVCFKCWVETPILFNWQH